MSVELKTAVKVSIWYGEVFRLKVNQLTTLAEIKQPSVAMDSIILP